MEMAHASPRAAAATTLDRPAREASRSGAEPPSVRPEPLLVPPLSRATRTAARRPPVNSAPSGPRGGAHDGTSLVQRPVTPVLAPFPAPGGKTRPGRPYPLTLDAIGTPSSTSSRAELRSEAMRTNAPHQIRVVQPRIATCRRSARS